MIAPPIHVPRTLVPQLLVRQIHVALIHVLLTLVLLTLAQLIRAPQKHVTLILVLPILALLKTPVPQPILVPLVGRVLHQLHHLMLAKTSFKRFMNA